MTGLGPPNFCLGRTKSEKSGREPFAPSREEAKQPNDEEAKEPNDKRKQRIQAGMRSFTVILTVTLTVITNL